MRSTRFSTLAVLAMSLGAASIPEQPRIAEREPLPEPVQAEKKARAERRRQEREQKRAEQYERAQAGLQAQSRYTRRFKP
jgi:hypothetical protein